MLFEPYAEDLVRRLSIPSNAAVLEVACGTGIVTQRLRRHLPATATLTATDLNEPMLAHARAKLPDAGITWRTADAQELPFADGSFDAVVCQFGLMFVPEKGQAFREMRRVLRAGGQLLFNVWLSLADNPHGRISRDTIARYLTSDEPKFYDVPFSFHDETRIREILNTARFGSVTAERVVREARSPTAEDAARGLVIGNPVFLDGATASAEEIVQALAAGLAKEGGAAPLLLPSKALVVSARAM